MSCPTGKQICFYNGTTYTQTYTVRDADGIQIDITNWTIEFKANDEDSFTKNATITDGPNGLASLELTAVDTGSIAEGGYRYQVTFSDVDSDPVQIYLGTLKVKGVL